MRSEMNEKCTLFILVWPHGRMAMLLISIVVPPSVVACFAAMAALSLN